MRVAVTGASGFVGRHLLAALARHPVDVVAASRQPVRDLARGIEWVELDISRPGRSPFAQLGRPDVLFHLAWDGLPNYGTDRHVEVEFPRQRGFLDTCLDEGLGRLAVTGTCLEYGLREGRQCEDHAPAPTTRYAEAKDLLHRHLLARRDDGSFGLGWFRLFYLLGPGQSPGSLMPQLEQALRAGQEEFDMSPGDQIRDFTPIEFAADALARIGLCHVNPGVVNICTGLGTTVLDLVERRIAELGASIRLNRGVYPYPAHEPRQAWGDTRRMNQLLETA